MIKGVHLLLVKWQIHSFNPEGTMKSSLIIPNFGHHLYSLVAQFSLYVQDFFIHFIII